MTIVDIQQDVRPLADVQDLLRFGQERGYVTSEEIMALVEEYDMTLEEIEDLYSQLFDQSIEIYEQEPRHPGCPRYRRAHPRSVDTDGESGPSSTVLERSREGPSPHQERRDPTRQAHRAGRQAGQGPHDPVQPAPGHLHRQELLHPGNGPARPHPGRATPGSSAPWRSSTIARASSSPPTPPGGYGRPSPAPSPIRTATSASRCT